MTQELSTPIVFTDQYTGGITAQKLNLSWRDATIEPAFIADKPPVSSTATGDYLLLLKADGTYAKVPPSVVAGGGGTGTGDMLKAVYDVNNNGVVDSADAIAWTAVTGKPATFPPDSTAMLKSVYDTNADNIVDRAANGIAAGGLTGQYLAKASPADYDTTWLVLVTNTEGIWNYSTNNAMADPGSGKYRTNTTTFSTATALAISKTTTQGTDRTNLLSQLRSGDTITIQDRSNSANYARYTVSATPTNNGTWFQIPVSFVNGGGSAPTNNTDCIFEVALAQQQTVTSVFGRTGTVLAQSGDYDWTQISGKPTTFPPDSTAMLKSVYDINANNKVDAAENADAAPWTGITGKPSTFPPDATAMLKSVYDVNADNIVDHAALADAIPWTGVTGKPATFPPDASAELVAHKGAVNGYAGLDASGKVPTAQLPAFGTGDMTKAVYDANADNIVDHAALADTAPWIGITGKPSTFPPDSTAMLKSVYDANADNIVDHAALADAAPWTGISGKPSTFPPDSTAMLKSVYDSNADNIVDHAALSDTAPWTGISGKPATFAPSAHAPSHLDNGSDPIAVATTTRTGLLPVLNGNAGMFLNGTGAFSAPAGGGDMLKSVYDTNADNVVDKAAALSTAGASHQFWKNGNVWGQPDWTDLTGIPTGNLVNPGTWTNLSYSTGWTQNTTAQFRVEVNGSFSVLKAQGIIDYASGAAALAFTLPAGARPSVARGCSLSGFDSTGDVMLFSANIATSGAVTIYPMVRQAFSWPSATSGSVYLDSLNFAL